MSRFANLSERLSADLPKDPTRQDDEEDETTTSNSKDKEKKDMSEDIEKVKADAKAQGFSEGRKAEADRRDTVMASEHFAGREELAKTLLATDLNAEQITASLAAAPKAGAASVVDADAQAQADLRDKLASNQPASLGTEGGEKPKADDADPVMKAAAKVNAINGLK